MSDADDVIELSQLHRERDALRARVAELEEELRFYADRKNWIPVKDVFCLIDKDEGERARQALGEETKP